jgi:hypothetical protein
MVPIGVILVFVAIMMLVADSTLRSWIAVVAPDSRIHEEGGTE